MSPRPILVALGIILVPLSVRAADPTKLECIAANDAAQDLRRAGKLQEAREKLLQCGSTSCPRLVREDCAQRLTEVDGVMPSLVFEVKDGSGNDVAGVTVTMDGQHLPGKLSSRLPVQVDPGEHRFVFEAEGLPATRRTIVVREWEQDRHERVVFGQPGAPGPSTPAASSSEDSAQKTIAYAVGGAGVLGLVVGAVTALAATAKHSTLRGECDGSVCPPSAQGDLDSFHTLRAVSAVGYVVGVLGIGGGAALWYLAPSRPTDASARVWVAPGAVGVAGEF